MPFVYMICAFQFSRNVGKSVIYYYYVASWPKTRIKAWDTLAARAVKEI
jgi:hypothetical protein